MFVAASLLFLRERFQPHLSFSRQAFRPNTPLEKLVPKQNRQLVWATLQNEVGAKALPDLARPIWLFWTLAASTIFVFFYATITIWNASNVGKVNALFCGLVATVAFGYISAIATRPIKQNFRRSYKRSAKLRVSLWQTNRRFSNETSACGRERKSWKLCVKSLLIMSVCKTFQTTRILSTTCILTNAEEKIACLITGCRTVR